MRDLPGKVIQWDAEWGADLKVAGDGPLDVWRAEAPDAAELRRSTGTIPELPSWALRYNPPPRASRNRLRAEVRHAEGTSALGVALSGVIDRRTERPVEVFGQFPSQSGGGVEPESRVRTPRR